MPFSVDKIIRKSRIWLPVISLLCLLASAVLLASQSNSTRHTEADSIQQRLQSVAEHWFNIHEMLNSDRSVHQFATAYAQSNQPSMHSLQISIEQFFQFVTLANSSGISGVAISDENGEILVGYNIGHSMREQEALKIYSLDDSIYDIGLLGGLPDQFSLGQKIQTSDVELQLHLLISLPLLAKQLFSVDEPMSYRVHRRNDDLNLLFDTQDEGESIASVELADNGPKVRIFLPSMGQLWLVWLALVVAILSVIAWLIIQWKTGFNSGSKFQNDIDIRAGFLASISHELRNPLNGMLGLLSLVKDTQLSQEQSRMLVSVQRSAEWLSQVVNDFLDYSKMDSGKIALEFMDFDIRQTVNDVAEMLSVQAYSKGIEIGCVTGSGIPQRVNGDPGRLRQILINLVSNAIKFTDQGDVAISVTAESDRNDAIWLRFDVVDTGMGIDTEMKAALFEPFEQGDESINKRFGGTGLGLAICRNLVELMGGEIDAKENSQGGATFWFSLPFEAAQQDTTPEIENSLAGYKILVAGEIAINRRTILETLQDWGLICHEKKSFDLLEKAILDAEKSGAPYDACIIDVSLNLTNQRAFEMVERIRKIKALNQVRLMLLTADGRPGDGMLAKNKGVQGYLTKPINRSQLRSGLQQIFRYADVADIPLITRHRLREVEADELYKILLIDENEASQRQLSALLQELSCQVDVTKSVKKALVSLQEKPYDMIMVDTTMLKGKYKNFLKQIRVLEEQGSVPPSRHERIHGVIPVMGLVDDDSSDASVELLKNDIVDGCIFKQANADHLDNFLTLWLQTESISQTEPDSLLTE